nr:YetF domain-containing protein [Halalkalibacter alkalisediminis]
MDQVETAIMETDGSISVLAKPPYLPAMQKDVLNVQATRGLAQGFIIDGKILHQSLKILGKDENWVREILVHHKIKRLEDVFYAQIDEQGIIYIDIRNDIVPNQFE